MKFIFRNLCCYFYIMEKSFAKASLLLLIIIIKKKEQERRKECSKKTFVAQIQFLYISNILQIMGSTPLDTKERQYYKEAP